MSLRCDTTEHKNNWCEQITFFIESYFAGPDGLPKQAFFSNCKLMFSWHRLKVWPWPLFPCGVLPCIWCVKREFAANISHQPSPPSSCLPILHSPLPWWTTCYLTQCQLVRGRWQSGGHRWLHRENHSNVGTITVTFSFANYLNTNPSLCTCYGYMFLCHNSKGVIVRNIRKKIASYWPVN